MTTMRRTSALVALAVVGALLAPGAAQAKTLRINEFKPSAKVLDTLRDRFIERTLATHQRGSWAKLRMELTNADLKLLGLPSRKVLLSQRYARPTTFKRGKGGKPQATAAQPGGSPSRAPAARHPPGRVPAVHRPQRRQHRLVPGARLRVPAHRSARPGTAATTATSPRGRPGRRPRCRSSSTSARISAVDRRWRRGQRLGAHRHLVGLPEPAEPDDGVLGRAARRVHRNGRSWAT